MKALVLIVLGHTVAGEAPLRGAVDFSARIQPRATIAVETIGGVTVAEAWCAHADGCGEHQVAWAIGPAHFAFDGQRLEATGELPRMLAGGSHGR